MLNAVRNVAFVLLCICAGCKTPRSVLSGAGLEPTPEVARAVQRSFSFQRALSIEGSRVIWFVDGEDGGYPLIYVGFDMGTHSCRAATLRVREGGQAERQEMTEDGDLLWVPDR